MICAYLIAICHTVYFLLQYVTLLAFLRFISSDTLSPRWTAWPPLSFHSHIHFILDFLLSSISSISIAFIPTPFSRHHLLCKKCLGVNCPLTIALVASHCGNHQRPKVVEAGYTPQRTRIKDWFNFVFWCLIYKYVFNLLGNDQIFMILQYEYQYE